MGRTLLTFNEFKDYTGFGRCKIQKMVSDEKCFFSLKNGNKWYIVKELFDKYIKFCAENNINLDDGYDKITT